MYEFIQIITAVIYGIVEGITEWLPVSSTGHLILLDEFLSFSLAPDAVFTAEFCEMFDVVIQLGAILAVVVTYFSRLWPLSPKKGKSENIRIWKLWGKVLIASVPAAIAGIVFLVAIPSVAEKIRSAANAAATGRTVRTIICIPFVALPTDRPRRRIP